MKVASLRLIAVAFLLLSIPALAQNRYDLTASSKLVRLSDPQISPDGTAIAVIIGAVYAGLAMNSAALSIESGIIEKEIDRVVVKTLDEQKSVALWDEPLVRIPRKDIGWIDEEIGSYLTGTYGHDLVIIQDGAGNIVYQHEKTPGAISAAQAIQTAGPLRGCMRMRLMFAPGVARVAARKGEAPRRRGFTSCSPGLQPPGDPALGSHSHLPKHRAPERFRASRCASRGPA